MGLARSVCGRAQEAVVQTIARTNHPRARLDGADETISQGLTVIFRNSLLTCFLEDRISAGEKLGMHQ